MRQRSILSPSSLIRGRVLLLWLLVSVAWLCLLSAGVCVKAGDQVAASSDLARELAQLDCTKSAAVCAAAAGPYGGSWSEIVATFVTYGFGTLLPLAVLPPLATFALGLAGSMLVRRLRPMRPPPILTSR
jgi:hypothetical protein